MGGDYRVICFKGRWLVVLEDGTVSRQDNGYTFRWSDNGNGYKFVGSSIYREYVHRLVCMAFHGDAPTGSHQVNHKDGNKSNNHKDNLEWITGSNNINHAHATGRMKKRSEYGPIRHVPRGDVVAMYSRVQQGYGITETAKMYGVSRTTLSSIINKRSRSDITDPLDIH